MNAITTLDVREFINSRKMSYYQWVLVLLCFLIVAVDGMDVAIMGFVAPSILSEWSISRSAFGIVMGAAPIGLTVGALLAGSSSDFFGRRTVLLASVLVFGIFTVLTAYTSNPTEMALLRFLTGLGLGAAMPNTTTLLSEYVPERSRASLVAIVFTGFNLGAALIGFVAAGLLPNYGWRSVLVFGGALPIVMVPVLYFYLPESARFMVVRGKPVDRIRAVLSKVCRINLDQFKTFVSSEVTVAVKQPIAVLFYSGYRLRTLTLWGTYFMGLLVVYLTTGWLPIMMKDAGMSVDRAVNVSAMLQLGGTFGALLVGWLMDLVNPNRVIASAYFLAATSMIVMGLSGMNSASFVIFAVAVGFCLGGAQTGMNCLVPSCYPTQARATGISWMQGIGRFGSILGASVGGILLSLGWGFEGIFTALAIPAILAGMIILVNKRTLSRAT